ncbi:MAG TPA: spore germination protein GerW family protein [Acidimicrobiia bacterium]|nr:spore germination protein GerW family protein [Acidimicrobiia bacterium]
MDVDTLLAKAQDSITVRRVYGEPIERDGVLIIPAAKVGGGGGAGVGDGTGPGGQGSGTGTGFGVGARPVGAFVVRNGEVTWQPAIDVTRIVLGGQIVAIVGFLTIRKLFGRRRRGRRHAHG